MPPAFFIVYGVGIFVFFVAWCACEGRALRRAEQRDARRFRAEMQERAARASLRPGARVDVAPLRCPSSRPGVE